VEAQNHVGAYGQNFQEKCALLTALTGFLERQDTEEIKSDSKCMVFPRKKWPG